MIGLKKAREGMETKDKLMNDGILLRYLTNGIFLQELSVHRNFLCTSCNEKLSITADNCVHCGETEFYWHIDRFVDSFLNSLQVCSEEKWGVEGNIEKANLLADNLFVLLLRIFLKYPVYYWDINQSYNFEVGNLKTLNSYILLKSYHIYSDKNIESRLIRPCAIKLIVSRLIISIKTTVDEESPFLFPFYLLESYCHYENLIHIMISLLDRNFDSRLYIFHRFLFHINRKRDIPFISLYIDYVIVAAEDALKCFNICKKNLSYKSSNSFPIKILELFLDECKSEKFHIEKELRKKDKKLIKIFKKSILRYDVL